MPLKEGDEILNGKYRLLSLIGKGGMARVWLAEELKFGRRKVAIKETKAGLSPNEEKELQDRFQREVDVCAALDQADVPNIVGALTAEPYGDSLLLVMEYMPGGDLAELIAKHPDGMPLDRAVAIALDLLRALEGVHAHQLDIVHRDIKPSNVLFDARGVAHLGDFGLAQLAGASGRSQLQGGQHPGTLLYMAPEQEISPRALTPAADLYALGCVLFEMVTGKRYKRYSPGARASALRPGIPAWLDALIARALAEDPWMRWHSAAELTTALKAAWAKEQTRLETRWQPRAEQVLDARQGTERQERDRQLEEAAQQRRATAEPHRPQQTVAYQRQVATTPATPGRIATATWPRILAWLVAGVLALVTLGVVTYLLWPSPSGPAALPFSTAPLGRIVFSVRENDQMMLHIADATTPGGHSLGVAGWSPAWAPDGKRIAFVAEQDGTSQVSILQTSDGSVMQLTDTPGEKLDPTWSPGGKEIAFVEAISSGGSLKVVGVENRELRALTDAAIGDVQHLAWSPDGRQIAFDAQKDGESRVYRVNADGSELLQLTDLNSWGPSWSPDGGKIAVSSEIGIHTMDSSGKARCQLNEIRSWSPRWSPDGARMAFLSDQGNDRLKPELWVMDAEGRNLRRWSTSGCWEYAWSPDGQWLAYLSGDAGAQPPALHIGVVNPTTQDRRMITGANETHMSWSD